MELTIEKLVYGGDGLARLPADEHGPGKAVFVPFVLEGEKAEVELAEQKKNFARANLNKILQPSPRRVSPHCPYYERCGGCHYQHTTYEHQVEIKAAILRENLRRMARLELDTELEIHSSPPWEYRNRTRLKVQTEPQFALGYYRLNSHQLLPVEQCPISSPLINRAITTLLATCRNQQLSPHLLEVEFFANTDDTQLLVEAYCAPSIAPALAKQLADDLKNAMGEAIGAVVFSGAEKPGSDPKQIAASGATELTYKTAHDQYRVSAGSFFQVNRHMCDELVKLVTEGRSGRTALDLYAGVGLFSTVLSRQFEHVIAVESSPTSHADLRYNSPANVKSVRSQSEQYLQKTPHKLQPDLVVVDPPRAGLGDNVIKSLVSLGAPRITYVSCDPATLSRDLGRFTASGYRVEKAHMVDLFPQTYHLESVFHLVR